MNNKNSSTEAKIKFLDRKATLIMPMILLLVDYLAIGLAEQAAYILRQALLGASSSFYISWLNYHVVFPACIMLFLNFNGFLNCNNKLNTLLE